MLQFSVPIVCCRLEPIKPLFSFDCYLARLEPSKVAFTFKCSRQRVRTFITVIGQAEARSKPRSSHFCHLVCSTRSEWVGRVSCKLNNHTSISYSSSKTMKEQRASTSQQRSRRSHSHHTFRHPVQSSNIPQRHASMNWQIALLLRNKWMQSTIMIQPWIQQSTHQASHHKRSLRANDSMHSDRQSCNFLYVHTNTATIKSMFHQSRSLLSLQQSSTEYKAYITNPVSMN